MELNQEERAARRARREKFMEEARIADEKRREHFRRRKEEILSGDLLDEDGYPTAGALELIEIWHWSANTKEWFKFIESLWAMKHFGWAEGETAHDWDKNKVVYLYELSTAGWSGNESIIRAMEKNEMLWFMTWVQSRRGGHYIFELDREYKDE